MKQPTRFLPSILDSGRVILRVCTAALVIISTITFSAAADDGSAREEGLDFPSINAVLWQDALSEIRSSDDSGINRFYNSEEKAELTPASALSSTVVESANSIDYTVGIESLYFIPKEKLDDELLELPRDELLLSLFNTLRSISSLEGIEYYSASRERMRTLFAETWVIRSPDDRTRLPDPIVKSIPEEDTVYIHQKDLTFGKNISEVVYRHEGNALSMSISNETTMRYMLFPLVKKGNMSMQMLILPVKEGIVFYGLSSIDVLDLKIFYDKMRDSFTNRLIALKDWFLDQVGD
jgi:hypothetical protein